MRIKRRDEIKEILMDCVTRTVERTTKSLTSNKSFKPFHKALLTEEIVKISTFERSFSTSFGQGSIEKISEIVAQDNGFKTERGKVTMVNAYKGAIDEVERICSALRGGTNKPNWSKEVHVISSFNKGDTVVKRIISDLWLEKKSVEHFISIKTVKPNLDQTEKATNDMLSLECHDTSYQTYFALYYNPTGHTQEEYSYGPPFTIFNMKKDPCVLIGEDYWNFLGGIGAYDELLSIFAEAGEETKKMLLGY